MIRSNNRIHNTNKINNINNIIDKNNDNICNKKIKTNILEQKKKNRKIMRDREETSKNERDKSSDTYTEKYPLISFSMLDRMTYPSKRIQTKLLKTLLT